MNGKIGRFGTGFTYRLPGETIWRGCACGDRRNCFGCETYEKYKRYAPPPVTNFDRIRSMSPLELAVWIAENCGCGDWCMHERSGACANSPKDAGHCCIDVWEDWLDAPVEVTE